MALKKLCSYHGCKELVDYGTKYCNKHKDTDKERYKEYSARRLKDKEQKKYQEFYNSKEWKDLAEDIRRKYNCMCVICLLRHGIITDVEAVHHIKELCECWNLRLDDENLICLCESCHRKIHVEYNKGEKAKDKMQEMLFELIELYEKEYGLNDRE